MTDTTGSTSRGKRLTLLCFAVFLAVIAWVVMPPRSRDWKDKLHDPDVQTLIVECGKADDPAGTGMPAWPEGGQRYYTRRRWADDGALKVEVWEFLEPGHVLVSADRKVNGKRMVIEPRWEVPPDAPLAGCLAKLGVEVTFRGLPRGDYVVEAR